MPKAKLIPFEGSRFVRRVTQGGVTKTELVSKKCSRCGDWKAAGDYHKDRHSRDGRRSDCKECRSKGRLKRDEKSIKKSSRWKAGPTYRTNRKRGRECPDV